MRTILVCLIFSIASFAQSPADVLKDVRQIKLLESTRDEVKLLLHVYSESRDDGDSLRDQTFSRDAVNIEVSYSSGECSEDPDEEIGPDVWSVEEGKVISVGVEWDQPISVNDLGIDLKRLQREQMDRDSPDYFIYHDRAAGIAVVVDDGRIRRLKLLPPRGMSKRLCAGMKAVRDFYSRKSWFSEKLEDRSGGCHHAFASVDELHLDRTEIVASGSKTISVSTLASDPENDVLIYGYTVSGGQIKGTGPKVIWDLTGVAPGTYTITAGVDDGCGYCGMTKTKTVTLN